MATQNSNRVFVRTPMVLFLAVTATLLAFSQVSAESVQTQDTAATQTKQVIQTPIWIQDPFSGESVMAWVREPDYSLWNKARITDYEESLEADFAPPLGVLTINKINLQVPIWNGTDDLTLDRGAGRIKGMARMDEDGNLGISGHRDGFFRGMKDVEVGDDILIQTTKGVQKYEVTEIDIVPKEDVSVLAPTTEKTLTIVTCYPFYYVGHAPKRWIITALPSVTELE